MLSMFSIGMMVGGIARNSNTLPYEVMPNAMQKVANILPLTQGIKILKSTTLGLPIENMLLLISLMVAIAVICSFIASKWFKWE